MAVKFPVKYPIARLRSVRASQKFSEMTGYGGELYGAFPYGWYNENAGIYRVRHYQGKIYHEKLKFYPYVITHTFGQNAQRAKYTAGYTAWRALSDSEKLVYNKRAIGRHYFGYHLFMKEYLKA